MKSKDTRRLDFLLKRLVVTENYIGNDPIWRWGKCDYVEKRKNLDSAMRKESR